jgi:hypothetical protein
LPVDILENYLIDLRDIRQSGSAVPETSYYPALNRLLNDVGKTLKPRVRCIMHPQNRGAGLPDGGFYSADQFARGADLQEGTDPARGVIEVKPASDDAWVTARSLQVLRYWSHYRQVLVTNLRDWVLVGQNADGNAAVLETHSLAASEAEFWAAATTPRSTSEKLEGSFVEFLKRVLLHRSVIDSPGVLAPFLASYAREARFRVQEGHLPALHTIREALEEALGIRFEGRRGDHFFCSTFVQTLFYGMFSAWVLWSRHHPPADRTAPFDWRLSTYDLRVPIVRKLFHEVAIPDNSIP